MDIELSRLIGEMNPWLADKKNLPLPPDHYIPRLQMDTLMLPDWDNLWLVLVGPRQAGKTTLGRVIAQKLVEQKRFEQLLYLNCDFLEVRQYLRSPIFLTELMEEFRLTSPILFIDEAQRLENPGLLLKGLVDLKLPIKLMATGSSQLELRSTIQEFLTGRHLEALVLPLSYREMGEVKEVNLIYGQYPAVVLAEKKEILLQQLYTDYIKKDIIEILKIGKPDVMEKLVKLMAHSSGQLVNYNQLATDCRVSAPTIQHYLSILENTYTLSRVSPFVGNKRNEITSNPKYYFIDNGFRNQALRQFAAPSLRSDSGLLIESAIYQELLKYKAQTFSSFDIHFWRTKGGAEVDFILYFNDDLIIPIEVKYSNMNGPMVSRSYRSYIEAYKPKVGIIVTKNIRSKLEIGGCMIYFVPFVNLADIFPIIEKSR